MSILIVGCGYLGERVASRFFADGRQVFATTRSAETADRFASLGWTPIIFDVTRPCESRAELPQVDTVLFAVGFDRTASDSIEEVYVNGLQNTLKQVSADVKQFIYISSTGVYGQSNGELINESSPTAPKRPGGKACLQAEALLRASDFSERSVILRLAGIYGPLRLPYLNAIRQQTPIEANANGWLNLIHVDDAVEIVRLADQQKIAPDLLVVSDGNPVKRGDYFAEIARQLAAPAPKLQTPDANTDHRRGGGGKRVDPKHLIATLKPTLTFPTFVQGIADTLAHE